MTMCTLPSTGGVAGITLAAIFLAVGTLLVLLVRRSTARLSVVAVVPLVAALGLGVTQPVDGCATTPTASTSTNSVPITANPVSSASNPGHSTGGHPDRNPGNGAVPTTERYSDDLTDPTTTWTRTTLPPAPTVTTTRPPSSAPTTPSSTSSTAPSRTTTPTPAPTSTVRPRVTWAPYLASTAIEKDDD
jgi:hypothetical protein